MGWAAYDGPGVSHLLPEAYRTEKVPSDAYAYWTTDEGQKELLKRHEDRCAQHRFSDNGLSPMTYANPDCLLQVTSLHDGWIEMELIADTGACDTVVPKVAPLSSIPILPSRQSEAG